MLILKFLWLVIRPLSKLESGVGWWDVLNLLMLVAYPTIGGVVPLSELLNEAPAIWWFGVPALLLLIAGLKLQKKLNGYESKTPRIVFQRGDVAIAALYQQKAFVPTDQEMDKTTAVGSKVYFIYVFLKNDPKGHRGEERTSKKTVAAVEVYGIEKPELLIISFWGSWRDTPQVITRPSHVSFQDLMEFDLPPNGLPHRIDFALKHDEDDDMYGYNDEAQRYSNDGRYMPFRLPKQFLVRIRVKAVGLDNEPSWWYRVDNGGKGIKPVITQLTAKEIRRISKSMSHKAGS